MQYNHLIIIDNPDSVLHFKEALDIALVSASYDIPAAVFLTPSAIALLQPNSVELAQSINMLADFSVPLFSEKNQLLYEQTIKKQLLIELKNNSRHHLLF